jgi:methyltransferase (TIGR00027 family)
MSVKSVSEFLGATAFWTASVRAKENAREDRLFVDPWAITLAGEQGAAWIAQRSGDSVLPIVLRTRYFDDFLQRITYQNTVRQVVLMAAGLDTRAYRLNWPETTHIFELDQSAVLEYKEYVLRSKDAHPTCVRHAMGIDLTGLWNDTLIKADFNTQVPTGWLLEGFLFYLPDDSITQIIDAVTNLSVPGSWMGFDIINSTMLTHPITRQWVEMQAKSGAPWIGTMDDPVSFLAMRGWKATLSQAGADDANYDRWPYPVIPTMIPNMPHNWYVTACKEP